MYIVCTSVHIFPCNYMYVHVCIHKLNNGKGLEMGVNDCAIRDSIVEC